MIKAFSGVNAALPAVVGVARRRPLVPLRARIRPGRARPPAGRIRAVPHPRSATLRAISFCGLDGSEPKLIRERPRGLADHHHVVRDRLSGNAAAFERRLVALGQAADIRERRPLAGAAVIVFLRAQSKTALRSISTRVCSGASSNPLVVTTCTGHPSSSSRSPWSAACLSRLRRPPMSTSTSRSLPGPASPRGTDPKHAQSPRAVTCRDPRDLIALDAQIPEAGCWC
jgi:hypothetical protein